MTTEEHKHRHIELHRALDELVAEWISNVPYPEASIQRPLLDLMKWSYSQTLNPTQAEREEEPA